MLRAITRFLEDHLQSDGSDPAKDHEQELRVASAALAVEALRADQDVGAHERDAAMRGLARLFQLSTEDTRELMRLAEQEADDHTSLFQFTHVVDRSYPREDKIRLVELLWEVVYADGHKDAREEHLVRKVADLLHVPHRDFIQARLRVEGALPRRSKA